MNHQHKWAKLLAEKDGKTIATSLFTCLKCGDLKIGKHTIRISRYRMDMDNKPIKNIGNPGDGQGGARNIWVQSATPTPPGGGHVAGDIWIETT